MWDNAVGRYIRRCNSKLLFLNAALLLLVIWWAYSQRRYISNCWQGPLAIRADSLDQISNPDSLKRYYVSLAGLNTRDTGYEEVRIHHDKYTDKDETTVSAHYYVATAGKRLFLIQSSDEKPATEYQGELTLVPSELREKFQAKMLDQRQKQFDSVFQPVMLEAGGFTTNLKIWLAVLLPLGLLALFNICRAMLRMGNIEATPSVRAMQRFPEGPEAVVQSIDQELQTGGNQSCTGSAWLTQSWLVRCTGFKLEPLRLQEIVWVYEKVVRHYTNFIPTGKSHAVIVATRDGRKLEFPMVRKGLGAGAPANVSAQFLHTLLARVPWAMAGYSDAIHNEFQRNREQFVKLLEMQQQGR